MRGPWVQGKFAGDVLNAGFDLFLDLRELGCTLGVAAITSILFGILPAFRAADRAFTPRAKVSMASAIRTVKPVWRAVYHTSRAPVS